LELLFNQTQINFRVLLATYYCMCFVALKIIKMNLTNYFFILKNCDVFIVYQYITLLLKILISPESIIR